MTGTRSKHTDAIKLGNRSKVALVLLCVGIVGMGVVGSFMYQKGEAVKELSAYANRGALFNVTDIFQIPAMMFFAILSAYAIGELYKSYKAMNNPDTYRNGSFERVGISPGRKVKREKSQIKKQPAAGQARRRSSQRMSDRSKDQSAGLSASQIPKPLSERSKVGRSRLR